MKNRILIFGFAATLAFNSSAGVAKETKTYRCSAKDAVSIMRDGSLDREVGKVGLKRFEKVVFDIPSGRITFSDTLKHEDWTVVETTLKNDYVLVPQTTLRRGHAVANAVTTFIRLRVEPGDSQPRFVAIELSYLVSGTCELVK